jgi:hypothetical protein
LAAECDPGGIAAEGCDVRLHPAERGLLIQDAVITPIAISIFTVQMAFRQKTKHAQPIAEGDNHGGGAKRTAGGLLAPVVVIGFTLNVAPPRKSRL